MPPAAAIIRDWQEPAGPLPNWDHELADSNAAPQRRLQAEEERALGVGAGSGAGAEAPHGRRLAQQAPPDPVTITLPRQISAVRTLFIPSEPLPGC
jgi:hypothetical protein